MPFNRPFSVAIVDSSETTFNESHMREDYQIFDLNIEEAEGDFCNLSVEIENPRVGLLAPGRPLWIWIAWNPNFVADYPDFDSDSDVSDSPSSGAVFDDMVPLFFGRVQGVPEDFIGETVTLNFLARPLDYDTQKAALAETLRVAPYFDGVWFGPDDRYNPDNVLESRSSLWNIDRVTHEVTISDIITGEDGTITFTGADVLDDSIRITYGDPPCRQVNVTGVVTWDQVAAGQLYVIGSETESRIFNTYTGGGLLANWPKPGQSIGGDWSVGDSRAVRVDGTGNDCWTYDNMLNIYNQAQNGKIVTVPAWATRYLNQFTEFPAHILSVKKWKIAGALAVKFNARRGKSETFSFTLRSDTQSILTDSTDGESVDLRFATSEVAAPVGVFSDGSFDFPLGKPWARSYITTDRGAQSLEYLIMVARAKLLASARCVDVTFEVPWTRAIEEGVNCRKNAIISDPSIPGGVCGGKIKSYALRANGDSGTFTCEITIGCTIGRGNSITAGTGTPTYVDAGYVVEPYQVHDGAYAFPIAGEVAYESIAGLPPTDDGFDFDRMTALRCMSQQVTVLRDATEQEPFILSADEPAGVYERLNEHQTHISFAMKPMNNGPFADTYSIATTLLAVPKTIDLEYADSSS